MVVPGVQLVAKLAGKIPGYKALAKIGVKNTARKTVKAASRGVGAIANGVGAIKSGVEAVGKKSRNVARGTRRGLARVRRFFGMKSRKAGSSRSRSRSRSKSKKSPSRKRNSNRKVKFAPNVRNTANACPCSCPYCSPCRHHKAPIYEKSEFSCRVCRCKYVTATSQAVLNCNMVSYI
jgi:hypothetical protein